MRHHRPASSEDVSEPSNLLALEVPLVLVICMLHVFVAIGIHEYKRRHGAAPWIHESSISCLLGLLLGFLLKTFTTQTVLFSKDFFFYLVLPPIIFSAGFGLKKKKFFKHLHLILLFGVVGTLVNFVLIAIGAKLFPSLASLTWKESFLLSAVLCGTDEVSAMSIVPIDSYPRLGALVFGEGVVNDALSIALFEAFYTQKQTPSIPHVLRSLASQLLFSSCIGVLCGLTMSFIVKNTLPLRHFSVYQTALVALCGYLSYALAEALGLSGILTLFICALVLSHYCFYSLSRTAQIASKVSFGALADIAEGFAFAYVGLSLWSYSILDDNNLLFAVVMLAVLLGARLVTVIVLTAIYRVYGGYQKAPDTREQIAFVLAGSVRGSLCWAQALQVERSVLATTALLVVMITTVGGGVLLPCALPRVLASPTPQTALSYTQLAAPAAAELIEDSKLGDTSSQMTYGSLGETPQKAIYTAASRSEGHTFVLPPTPPRAGILSRLFLQWVIFDETVLKAWFGGSAPDAKRRQLLRSIACPPTAAHHFADGPGGVGVVSFASADSLANDGSGRIYDDPEHRHMRGGNETGDGDRHPTDSQDESTAMLSLRDEAIRDYFTAPDEPPSVGGASSTEEALLAYELPPAGTRGRGGTGYQRGGRGGGGGLRLPFSPATPLDTGHGDEDEAYLSRISLLWDEDLPRPGAGSDPAPDEDESESWLDMSTLTHLRSQPRAPRPAPQSAPQPLRRPGMGIGTTAVTGQVRDVDIGRLTDTSVLSPIRPHHR